MDIKNKFTNNNLTQIITSVQKYQLLFIQDLVHTPLEGSSGSEQSTRLMTFTQPFYDISGIQNRKEQNFLARTFSVIAILRYPTFPNCLFVTEVLLS